MKDGMKLMFGSCPRPLSRKKLRSLMPHSRDALTGSALAAVYGRKPGPGRFRHGALRQMDELEEQQQAAGERGVAERAAGMLKRLQGLFGQRDKSKVAQQHKARRGT